MKDFVNVRNQKEKVLEANKKMNIQIENTLKQLDKTLAELDPNSKAFIVHESDKYYKEMAAGYEKSQRTGFKGFHGRSIAILNYINIMASLSEDFGIGNVDLMKFVAYNLPEHSPGAGMESSLEQIFTYAAGIIMFDDVAVAVKEAKGTL
jgi:hypothetical protein